VADVCFYAIAFCFCFVTSFFIIIVRACFLFFLFSFVRWVGKLNFFLTVLFYQKPKDLFKLNTGIFVFRLCTFWRFYLSISYFGDAGLYLGRTKIGRVYLAQNLYSERGSNPKL